MSLPIEALMRRLKRGGRSPASLADSRAAGDAPLPSEGRAGKQTPAPLLHRVEPTAAEGPTIVIADDDWGTRMLVVLTLEPDGYEVRSAASARELAETLADRRVSLVLLDIRLGGDNGIEIARRLADERPELAVAFLTGASYLLDPVDRDLAHSVIEKPFTCECLWETVASVCGPQHPGKRLAS